MYVCSYGVERVKSEMCMCVVMVLKGLRMRYLS